MIWLSSTWRVRSLDEVQWVLEHEMPGTGARGALWRAWAYCRTREGLETALSRLRCGWRGTKVTLDPALLSELPERFPSP